MVGPRLHRIFSKSRSTSRPTGDNFWSLKVCRRPKMLPFTIGGWVRPADKCICRTLNILSICKIRKKRSDGSIGASLFGGGGGLQTTTICISHAAHRSEETEETHKREGGEGGGGNSVICRHAALIYRVLLSLVEPGFISSAFSFHRSNIPAGR